MRLPPYLDYRCRPPGRPPGFRRRLRLFATMVLALVVWRVVVGKPRGAPPPIVSQADAAAVAAAPRGPLEIVLAAAARRLGRPDLDLDRHDRHIDPRRRICADCAPGDPFDGGLKIGKDGSCQAWCSRRGRCGSTGVYVGEGATDCRDVAVMDQLRKRKTTAEELMKTFGDALQIYSVQKEETFTELQEQIEALQEHVIGQQRVDAVHDGYIQSAARIQAQRLADATARAQAGLPNDEVCDLTVAITSAARGSLEKDKGYKQTSYAYLERTLTSLRGMSAVRGGLDLVCVLVVNMSPGEHVDYDRIQRAFLANSRTGPPGSARSVCAPGGCPEASAGAGGDGGGGGGGGGAERCAEWCWKGHGGCGSTQRHRAHGVDCRNLTVATRFRFVKQANFEDPVPFYIDRGDQVNQAVSANSQTRRQGVHLSHTLLEATRWPSRYTMIVEDDMPVCSTAALEHLVRAIALADKTAAGTGTGWSMLRVGFGGNGVLFHSEDAVGLGAYLLQHMARRPVDWLMPEWGASMTFGAKLVNLHRRIYTYRLNLFLHIGTTSNFDREWNAETSHILPGCYEPNTFLRQEERFAVDHCAGKMISPCFCPEQGTFC